MPNNNMSKYRIFTKTPWDRKSAVYYTLLAFVSAFYAVLFDYARIDAITSTPKDAAFLALCAASYCLPLFFALMLSKWVFVFSTPILFYIGAVGHIYATNYMFNVTEKTAPLFFNNTVISIIAKNPDNAAFMGGMFALGLAVGLVRFFYAKDSSITRRGQAFAVMLIMTAAATGYIKEAYPNFLPQPYAYISSIQKYANDKAYHAIYNNKRSESDAESGDNVTGIIIFVDRLSNEGNFTGGKNFATSYKFGQNFGKERHNMLSALTGAGKKDPNGIIEYPTLLSIFDKAGYPTIWFNVSNQFSMPDLYINKLMENEAGDYVMNGTEGSPNPFLAVGKLDYFAKNNTKGLFVISIEGTTPKISKRYKNIFKYKDLNGNVDEKKAYQNYVRHLEALIEETKKRLEDKMAFIILAGLEGEEISDTNDFKAKSTEGLDSIFGIWFSPKIRENIDMEKISDKLKDKTSPDMVYHTAIGCAGIKTPNLDHERNICSNTIIEK